MFEDNNLWGEDPDWAKDDSENDSDNEDSSSSPYLPRISGAQHVIIIIDASPIMFRRYLQITESDDNVSETSSSQESDLTSPFETALMAAERLVHSRIHKVATTKQGKRDGVGILLFNAPTQNKDMIHVGLNAHDGYDSLRTALELEPPGVRHIQSLRGAIKCPGREKVRDFESEIYGMKLDHSKEDVHDNQMTNINTEGIRMRKAYEILVQGAWSLRSALQKSLQMFLSAKCVKKISKGIDDPEDMKSIWIFTNQDDPSTHTTNDSNDIMDEEHSSGFHYVYERCNELAEDGIEINLIPLPKVDGARFDTSIFYHKIIVHSDVREEYRDLSDLGSADCVDVETILDRIDNQWSKPRGFLCIPMLLPDWDSNGNNDLDSTNSDQYRIMIDIYKHIRIKKRPTPIKINARTGNPTRVVSQLTEAVSGGPVTLQQLRYYSELGDEKIRITPNDVQEIKRLSNQQIEEAYLVLLGFKPMIDVFSSNEYLIIGSSLYAYPNESFIKGSTAAFATLHECMLVKKVMGIGELLTRNSESSRMVAIVPQKEEVDDSIATQVIPPGFVLVPLAFEDDNRDVHPIRECGEIEEALVKAAENIVLHQNIEKSVDIGSSFANPALKSFWNLIESIALKKELLEESESNIDDTKLDQDALMQVCASYIRSFSEALPLDDDFSGTKKRNVDAILDDSDWEQEYLRDTDEYSHMDKLDVSQLKSYLRKHSMRLGGRKAELVARVKEHIQSRVNTNKSSESL
jgi:ATP-dependent DNA helicase II